MKLRLSFSFLFLTITLLTAPSAAMADVTDTVTVIYASSGPGQPDGYENAQVTVQYTFNYYMGDLYVKVKMVKGSVKASSKYWFDGEQLNAIPFPDPEPKELQFKGFVMHNATQIAELQFNLPVIDSKDITNEFKEFLKSIKGKHSIEDIVKNLRLQAPFPSSKCLENPKIHEAVRAARAKAKKEAEEAEREKKKKAQQEEQAKKEKERKEAEEKEKKDRAEAEKKKQDYASGDFWGTGSKSAPADTAAAASASGAGRYVRTTDGGYWWQGADGKNRQVSAAEYNAPRDRETETRRQAAAEETAKKNEETSQRFFADQQRRQEERERTNQAVDRIQKGFAQSFYIAEAAGSARENIRSLSKMDGNYESSEELEADYDRRMRALDQEISNLEAAERQGVEAAKEMFYGGGSETDRAAGNLVGMLATMANNADREAKKREAQARLNEQREQMQKQIAAKRHAAMIEGRKSFLAKFPDGNVPLSSHKVPVDTLYFFSYTFDKNAIENPNPQITLANTFPVARYGDGTWPFKHSINSDLRRLAPGENTLMGYYATRELADEMRATFIKLGKKNGFVIKDVKYAGRDRSGSSMAAGSSQGGSAGSAPDFWSKPDVEKKPVKSEADFWSKPDAEKKPVKSDADFWK